MSQAKKHITPLDGIEASQAQEWIPSSAAEWIKWLSTQEDLTIRVYTEDPDRLIADYRRERQITKDYQGREILELLQNANDAAAELNCKGRVLIDLSPDGLLVANTGKPFTTGGVRSLRITDLSPKQSIKKKLIGQKGLGFRSVLNWSRQPLILSGSLLLTYSTEKLRVILERLVTLKPTIKALVHAEHYGREGLVLPVLPFPIFIDEENIDSCIDSQLGQSLYRQCLSLRNDGYDTIIGMPFNKESSFSIAKEGIHLLRPEILLFTDNLDEIRIRLYGELEKNWQVKKENSLISIITEPDTVESQEWHLYKKAGLVPLDILDESADSSQEYQIVLAVPNNLYDITSISPLFSFFPTEIMFPFPAICHATIELETNRKHPSASPINDYIFANIATFLVEVAVLQSIPDDVWCKSRLLARTRDLDPLLERFNFLREIIEAAKDAAIIPTIGGLHAKPTDTKYIKAKDLSWLPDETFIDIALPPDDKFLRRLLDELEISKLTDDDFRQRLNSLTFRSIDARASVIAGVINNNVVPKDPSPDLLIDEQGRIIKYGSRVYLPPIETAKKYDLPEWLTLRFINRELRASLVDLLNAADQRGLRQKLSPFDVNEYALGNVAGAIIAEVKRMIDKQPEKSKQYIEETLIALLLMFPEDTDPPKLPETTGIPLPNSNGTLSDARELYFGRGYAANGELLSALYENYSQESLLAAPEIIGLDGNDQRNILFLKWIGVADLPRETLIDIDIDKVDSEYFYHVLDSLPYPIKLGDYTYQTKGDFNQPVLNNVKTIDKLEVILQAEPGAILAWLAIDERASRWKFADSSNGELQEKPHRAQYNRRYYGNLPNYIFWKIKNTAWLPVADNKKERPARCLLSERSLEKILPTPIEFKYPLFETYNIDRLRLRLSWENSGVLPDISYLSHEQIVEILNELPIKDTEGKYARSLYRNIVEKIDPDRNNWKGPPEYFINKGLMFGKGPAGYSYYPVKELRHADTDEIPEALATKIKLVDLPKRVGARKVQKIFGIEPIDRRKFTVEIITVIESPKSKDIQVLFQRAKPYLYALRQIKTKQQTDINNFKRLQLTLCTQLDISLRYESINMDSSITEPYKWILHNDMAYIFHDPNDELSFESDRLTETIGEILATIVRIDNGGDFARILRCNESDRLWLLSRILGDTLPPDIEELKKEFEEAIYDLPPIILPVSKTSDEQTPTTTKTDKIEQSLDKKNVLQESPESFVALGDIKVTEEKHRPTTATRKQDLIRKKSSVADMPVHTMRRVTNGDLCERRVMSFEESEGRWPLKVSDVQGYNGPRCDILSFKSKDDLTVFLESLKETDINIKLINRFIEVKGRSSEKGAIILKGNELDAAKVYADHYYLYRLYEKSINDYYLTLIRV